MHSFRRRPSKPAFDRSLSKDFRDTEPLTGKDATPVSVRAYLEHFSKRRVGSIDEATIGNALLVLGFEDAALNARWSQTFRDMWEGRPLPVEVPVYYDPKTDRILSFGNAPPEHHDTKKAIITVGRERILGLDENFRPKVGITNVRFEDSRWNFSLRNLVGLIVKDFGKEVFAFYCSLSMEEKAALEGPRQPPAPLGKPLDEETYRHLIGFLRGKLGAVSAEALTNALIVLGDQDTIAEHGVGPSTFANLLAGARQYPATIHCYYDPKTDLLKFFSGANPEDKELRHVRIYVDYDAAKGGEYISQVHFSDGQENLHLKALEGLPLSEGGMTLSVSEVAAALEKNTRESEEKKWN